MHLELSLVSCSVKILDAPRRQAPKESAARSARSRSPSSIGIIIEWSCQIDYQCWRWMVPLERHGGWSKFLSSGKRLLARKKITFANPMFNFRELSRRIILHLHQIRAHIRCIHTNKVFNANGNTYKLCGSGCCGGSSSSWENKVYSTTYLRTHEATSG